MVTGNWEPVPLEEADRAVRLLPVRPLLLTHGVWTDFLRADASLDLRSRAPHGVQSDLGIRGATFGQTLVLLDGFRLNDPQTGHHNLDIPIPMEALSRIEVLRGSGSTLYGADAVGGVVHFLPAEPAASAVRLRAAAGNFGVQEQRAWTEYRRGEWSQQLGGARDFSTGFRPNRDYRNLSLASVSRHAAGGMSTTLLLAYNDRAFGAEGFYGPFPSWERTGTRFASLSHRRSRTSVGAAYRRHTDWFVLERDRPSFYSNRHRSDTWQAGLRRREEVAGNARLFWGMEAYRDAIVSSNLGRHARARLAGYGALDVRALGRFSLSLGARQESYRPGAAPLAPSLAGGVWLNPRLKLRGAVSRAFRLPTFTELYYVDPVHRGSAELRPEQAWSYEAGADFHGGRFQASWTAFERRERDGIDYVRNPGDTVWRAANLRQTRLRGLEFSGALQPAKGQQMEMAWTALHGAAAALAGLESKYVFNYPSQSAVIGWRGNLRGVWTGWARLHVCRRTRRPAYAVWDVALARDGARWRPFARLYNLTGTRYEEVAGVPMPGRSAVIGLELVLGAGGRN